jgi:hypothetical protein
MNKSPTSRWHRHCRGGNVFASAKFPTPRTFFHIVVFAHAITPDQSFVAVNAARLLRSDGSMMGN